MPYLNNGTLTTDKREVAIDTTWDTQTDWTAYQSEAGVDITNGVVTLAEQTQPDSGILRYPLDSDAVDVWNSYDGTANGATFVSDSSRGGVAEFDGTDDLIDVPQLPTDLTEVSYAGWFRIDEAEREQRSSFNLQDPYVSFRFHAGSVTDEIALAVYDDSTVTIGTTHDASAWSHYVITAAENGEFVAYINGSSIGSQSIGSFGRPSIANNYLGADRDGGRHVNGRVDEFRVYDKQLTAQEVSDLYNTGSIL